MCLFCTAKLELFTNTADMNVLISCSSATNPKVCKLIQVGFYGYLQDTNDLPASVDLENWFPLLFQPLGLTQRGAPSMIDPSNYFQDPMKTLPNSRNNWTQVCSRNWCALKSVALRKIWKSNYDQQWRWAILDGVFMNMDTGVQHRYLLRVQRKGRQSNCIRYAKNRNTCFDGKDICF